MTISIRVVHPAALLAGILAFGTACRTAPPRLDLVTHAAFFSQEMNLSPALDPHVFVREDGAPAGRGPQQIDYVAGLRNARINDPGSLAIYTARGIVMEGFSLGSWLGATGRVTIVPGAPGPTITVEMAGLRPGGVYSLFQNHFDRSPVGFTPLDGSGTTNRFVADARGAARVTVVAPAPLTHDNAVLIVYHSDGRTHGTERGPIGVTAHHQLIARIPR